MPISPFELAFYKHICANPEYFASVEPHYFKDEKVKVIYTLVRDYYKQISDKGSSVVISPFDLSILLEARDRDIAKQINPQDLQDFVVTHRDTESSISDDYISSQLQKWVKWERFKGATTDLSLEFKKIENESSGFVGIDNIDRVIAKLKDGFNGGSTVSFDNSYIDFFDPQAHIVNEIKHYSTGYPFIDLCSDGGYWSGSLWIIAGAPKAGKSVTLQNFLSRSVAAGNNSAYISLEMQDGLSLKRLSAITMDIKISEYDAIKNQGPEALKSEFDRCIVDAGVFNGGSLNSNIGKIPSDHGDLVVKTFPTGTLTVTQLENFLLKVERDKSFKHNKIFKFQTIYLDYINIMLNEKNPSSENTYLKIKTLAEDLRAMAQRNDWCIISATQTNREQADSGGISVSNIAESVGLNATVDMMFGIIKTIDMDANGVLDLKCLLSRVSEYTNYRKEYHNNKDHLRLTESDSHPYIDSTMASPESKKGTKHGEAYSKNYTDSLLSTKDAVSRALAFTAKKNNQRHEDTAVAPTVQTVVHNAHQIKEVEKAVDNISPNKPTSILDQLNAGIDLGF